MGAVSPQAKENQKQYLRDYYQRNKEAGRAARKENYEAHREERLAKAKKDYQDDPYRKRLHAVKTKFGLSKDEYEQMRKEADGRCGICGQPQTKRFKYLSVDHDHKTGQVRELLCNDCNLGLGCFKDDPERVRKALEYLERWGNVTPSE